MFNQQMSLLPKQKLANVRLRPSKALQPTYSSPLRCVKNTRLSFGVSVQRIPFSQEVRG